MPRTRKFHIEAFWKNQAEGSASKLPEDTREAPFMFDAVSDYINEHRPWLNDGDVDLVMQHTREV